MFIKTYNYLKLKTLPSSVLNKCRVLLERNSKYRRITSQFGSTFRNSKWTDYSLNNLTPLNDFISFNPFLKGLNYSLLFMLFSSMILLNYPTFFLDYNLPLTSYISTIFNPLYTLIDYSSLVYAIAINILLVLTSTLPFYNLTTVLFNNKINSNFINFEKLFNYNSDNTILAFNNISDIYSDLDLISTFNNKSPSTNFSFENAFYRTFLYDINLDRPLLEVEPLLKINPSFYQNLKRNESNEYRSSGSYHKYLPLNTTKLDPKNLSSYFYLNDLDFKKINFISKTPELLNFNTNLSEQLSIINSLRWSYRYSNLHRRVINNSHKLTESKKLISSGFFDINITNENLWFSDKYARNLDSKKSRKSLSSKDLISSNWKVLYNTTFFNNLSDNNLNMPLLSNNYNNLIRLSFYESSFHFFLKRLNNFNNLLSNKVSSVPSNGRSKSSLDSNYLNNLQSIYNISLSNRFKDLLDTNPSNNYTNLNKLTIEPKVLSDIVLIQKPSYFLTKKKIDILYNLTKYSSSNNLNLRYFIKLNTPTNKNFFSKKTFKVKQFKKKIRL